MILSASRRTDIPAFFSEWFMNRIREGFVMARNPMNYNHVSKINLSPQVVDCIVFWSKNPAPLLPCLDELKKDYPFYFQYTINGYESDLEPNLPPIDERIRTFLDISAKFGKDSVIWRYDPIILTDQYTPEWHINTFCRLAERLKGYTDTCVFSFVDLYDKVKNNMKQFAVSPFLPKETESISEAFSKAAMVNGMKLNTWSEAVDLARYNIGRSCCIEKIRIEKLTGCEIKAKKDTNQRPECGCIESVDIGQYNTCLHGCKYCYANYSQSSVKTAVEKHDPFSPLLVGDIGQNDRITERKVKSLKENQISLF